MNYIISIIIIIFIITNKVFLSIIKFVLKKLFLYNATNISLYKLLFSTDMVIKLGLAL
jgi:hypothetical protein